MMSTKTNPGNFFEDFHVGMNILHATPRTVTGGDVSLYTALYGNRFAVQSSSAFAQAIGLPGAPLDDMLLFHMVFGKTVPDVSLNAIANLGYASGRFHALAYPGDTLRTVSEVIGLKENSNAKTGTVYVRSVGTNQRDETVLEYIRWVMVRKKDLGAPAPEPVVPELPEAVAVADLIVPNGLDFSGYDTDLAGSPFFWEDYEAGEKIDHVDAMTVEEADHMIATRLYQNTAKVHFNQHTEKDGRFGKRIVYGGHVISLAILRVQRPGQCLQDRRHQRRAPRGAHLRRRHRLFLVAGPEQGRVAGPIRSGCVAIAVGSHQGSGLRRIPVQGRRREIRPGRGARLRLHGSDSAQALARPRLRLTSSDYRYRKRNSGRVVVVVVIVVVIEAAVEERGLLRTSWFP
jgi:2-methylfumaryl-CoA hydratase